MSLKVGSIYSYKGREVVLVGYNLHNSIEQNSYNSIAIGYLLSFAELREYYLWKSAIAFDLKDNGFFYFSTDNIYSKPLYLRDMEDFDTFFLKLLLMYSDFISTMSMHLLSQEEAVEELNSQKTTDIFTGMLECTDLIVNIAKSHLDDILHFELTVFDCRVKFKDKSTKIAVITPANGSIEVEYSKHNFILLYALAVAGAQFIGYYKSEINGELNSRKEI